MDTAVIYNQGKDAAWAGSPRQAPSSIMYPIVSRYEPFRREKAYLDVHQQKQWLRGYDAAQAERERRFEAAERHERRMQDNVRRQREAEASARFWGEW